MTIKLNIGCGRRDFGEDWDHIDGSDYPHIKSHNIINLPYENNSVDLIYASHVFEYFDREEAIIVLENWKKVLELNQEWWTYPESVDEFQNRMTKFKSWIQERPEKTISH